MPLEQLRAAIGVVPQDAFVFSDTIENNIALGIPTRRRRAASGSLGRGVAQLTDTIAAFPPASPPGSASAASTCPVASASAPRWPAPSPATRHPGAR
jgi:hypothetical protein